MTHHNHFPSIALSLLATVTVGCTTPNPNYRWRDAGPDAAPPSCPDEVTCSGATGVCNTDKGQCVMCTATESGACMGNTPVCGSDNVCRGCTAHSECASEVCLPNGQCSAEGATDVAYVAPPPRGAGTDCTKAAPCALLSTALKTNRDYIKITGAINDNPTIDGAQTVMILADPGAKLMPKSNGILLELKGASNLTIYDLELSGAQGNSSGVAISMPLGNLSTLSLHRVKLLRNTGAGIEVSGGTLRVFQSTIAENAGGGINMNHPTTFEIRNNFIVRNGTDLSLLGGVRAIPVAGSKFEFNTVVSNKASNAAIGSAGLVCTDTIPAPFNLVFNNSIGLQMDPQITVCDPEQKSVRTEPSGGAGFRKNAPNDYHLTSGTPAGPGAIRDAVPCDSVPELVDFDGENRPKNGMCDLGADEY